MVALDLTGIRLNWLGIIRRSYKFRRSVLERQLLICVGSRRGRLRRELARDSQSTDEGLVLEYRASAAPVLVQIVTAIRFGNQEE